MDRGRRAGWARALAPVAFLAAVTIAVLLIRSGLNSGDAARTVVTTTAAARPHSSAARPTRKAHHVAKVFYTVQSGDTFGSIAARYAIAVSRLEQLNPGVSSNSLSVGQKIRVK